MTQRWEQRRLSTKVALRRDSKQRLRACWSRCLQPAQQELERRLREWESCANDMPFAVEGGRRAEAAARNAEQLHARAHQRAMLAKGHHDAAYNSLWIPRQPGQDYGAPVAAEHRARVAYGTATRNLKNITRQVEAARAAASRAGDLVGGCGDGESLGGFGGGINMEGREGRGVRFGFFFLSEGFWSSTTYPRPSERAVHCSAIDR